MKYKLLMTIILLCVLVSCKSGDKTVSRISFLTNDSIKYWSLVKYNDNIINKKSEVWMFGINGDFFEYYYKTNDSLFLIDSGDKLYTNKFSLKNNDIYINSYKYKLIFLSNDSLNIKNSKSDFTFIPNHLIKNIDSTKPKKIVKINGKFYIK